MRVQRTLCCLLGFVILASSDDSNPKVCINDGCLIGTREASRLGREFISFLGVPFAKPPIDELRFKPPEKPDRWEETRDATKDGNVCPQAIFHDRGDTTTSEDCLYLNVYTPQIPRGEGTRLLPVIVTFHPGTFQYWSGTRNHFPANYFLDRDVVIVSANYRLNIFGFLSTEDEVSPGNYGLKDQTLTLEWVRDNIAHFGGNPQSVTIHGQDAGGASVHFHMLSPLSRGLFHRAIAQSGTALAPWAMSLPGEAREHAQFLAKYLKCPHENSTAIFDCLRSKSTAKLLETDVIFFVWHIDPIVPWKPVVEPDHPGAFLLERPTRLLEGGLFADVPFMTGVTSREGIHRAAGIFNHDHILANLNALPMKSYPSILNFYHIPVEEVKDVIMKIMKFYFKSDDIVNAKEGSFINMVSDRYFHHPMIQSIKLQRQRQTSPIFAYKFFHKPREFSFARYFSFIEDFDKSYKGLCHGDDLFYLHPLQKIFKADYELDDRENAMINRTLDLWINFATHSHPTPEGYEISWEAVSPDSEKIEVLEILRVNGMKMSLFDETRVEFWSSLNLEREITEDADYLNHDEL